MRVMIVADTYPPQINGVASSVSTLARALSRQGHEVMVCTAGGRRSRGRASASEPFAVMRARAVPLPLYGDLTLAPPIGYPFGRLVRRFRPEVIHCHTPFSLGWQAARAAHASGIPVVGTHHTLFGDYVAAYLRLGGEANTRLAALLRRYVAVFYNQCDLVTCASRYLARDLVSGGMTRPLTIVPNALDTDRFRPLPGAALREASACRRIFSFGRLAPEKNLPRLLRLVAPVLRERPEMRFEIAGDGPVRGALVALARELDLERQVNLVGWLRGTALVEHLVASDVCVSASLTENQPMALLESLACGVPVVALAAGGVPEIIEDGGNGFLVAPDDAPEMFARRLEQVLDDAPLRRRLAARARETALAHSDAACLRMTLATYHEAVALGANHTAQSAGKWLWRAHRVQRAAEIAKGRERAPGVRGLADELRLAPERMNELPQRAGRLPG